MSWVTEVIFGLDLLTVSQVEACIWCGHQGEEPVDRHAITDLMGGSIAIPLSNGNDVQ